MMLTRSAHGSKLSPDRCSQTERTWSAIVGLYWKVESTVGGINRARPDARPLPIDHSAESVSDPQHVARVEVAMNEADSHCGTGIWNNSTACSHSAGSVVHRGGS
jgi:hypothetical protein